MYQRIFIPLIALGGLLFSASAVASLDAGDYSSEQTFKNIFNPPAADAPISAADFDKLPITLPLPRADFNDHFNPRIYGVWQEVTLDPATGASCGDGSPYKFWVKRQASTSNIQMILEGGGACFDYAGCSGNLIAGAMKNVFSKEKNLLGFFAASTLKQNTALSMLLLNIGTAFSSDFHPHYANKSQKWNKIYLPYCTGDVHMGFGTTLYIDEQNPEKSITVQHKGAINVLQAVAWLRNNVQAPQQFMMSGFSAGGVGANALYFAARRLMGAPQGYLLNDGGPIWFTDMTGSVADNPTQPLFKTALKQWGISRPMTLRTGEVMSVLDWYQTQMPQFDQNNMGSLNNAIALAFPQDRLALLTFQEDYVFSSYIYRRFFPQLQVKDAKTRRDNTLKLWQQDLNQFTQKLTAENFGYYLPATREFLYAHTLSGNPDKTADIQELNLSMSDYVKTVTDGEGAVMRAQEQDFSQDRQQQDLFGKLMVKMLQWMGV